MKEYELTNNITITADHMDMHNQHTFEVEDLKNLILRVSTNNCLFFLDIPPKKFKIKKKKNSLLVSFNY